MAALAASWGLISVLAAAVDLDAGPLAFLRLAIGAVTVALVAVVVGRGLGVLRPQGRLASLALLGAIHGVHWALFFEAVKRGSVALASITFYTAPLFLALVAPLVLRERVSRVALAALVPGGIGVTLVALTGSDGGRFSTLAVAAGLGSAATYALFVVGSKRLLRDDLDPLALTFWDTAFGALVVAPLLLGADRILPVSGGDWAAVLALGAVFSGLATLGYALVLRRITAQTAGVLTFLEPVSAVVLAAVLVSQPLGLGTVLGGLLVVVAGVIVIALEPDETDPGAAYRQ